MGHKRFVVDDHPLFLKAIGRHLAETIERALATGAARPSLCTSCCRFPSRSSKSRSSAVSSGLPWALCWFSVQTTAAISHRRATTSSRRRGGASSSETFACTRASGLAHRSFGELGLCGRILQLCCGW
jgi:hypothetical protein